MIKAYFRDISAEVLGVTFYNLAPLRPIWQTKPRHSPSVELSQLPPHQTNPCAALSP